MRRASLIFGLLAWSLGFAANRTSAQAGGYAAGRPVRLLIQDAYTIKNEAYLIKTVSPELRRDVAEVSRYNAASRPVRGVWPDYQRFRSLKVQEGRLMTDDDETEGRRVVVLGVESRDQLFPGQAAIGAGRLIAVGDASIPINAMMRYPGNRALARSLVHYATDDDVWGKRGGTLYILTNTFGMTGTFGDDSLAGSATVLTSLASAAVNLPIVWRTTRDKTVMRRLTLEMATVIATGIAAVTIDRIFQFSELLVRK